MKDYYQMRESMAAVAEAYAEMNEAFALTKSNFTKVKSLDKLMTELAKFAKKAGHKPFTLPPGSGFSKRDVSKPKGFYSPVLMELMQSLYYTSNDAEEDEWINSSDWSNKMAKTYTDKQTGGLDISDPDEDFVKVIRASIFIAMKDMFEANPEFMKQYGTPEKATKMFIK
jgi:hypothetical protein